MKSKASTGGSSSGAETLVGLWRLPGGDREVSGFLTLAEGKAPSLVLVGSLSAERLYEVPAIQGYASPGGLVTVLNCSLKRTGAHSAGGRYATSTYEAQSIVIGDHVDGDNAPKYTYMRVRFVHLDVWAGVDQVWDVDVSPTDSFTAHSGPAIAAFVSANVTMALSQRTQERPYGEPWVAVRAGYAFEISTQLCVPASFRPDPWFDRVNTIWWVAALIRLRTAPAVVVPVVADREFGHGEGSEGEFIGLEYRPIHVLPNDEWPAGLTTSDLEWLRTHIVPAGRIMHDNATFRTAFQAFDYAASAGSVSLALISIWGALEELFSPAKQELRYRVSSSIAAYLEPAGEARLNLHKSILKLYDARSRAAHGTARDEHASYAASYTLMRRVLGRIIEDRRVPSRMEIERLVFGCDASLPEQSV